MICPYCKEENEDNREYCKSCGQKLSAEIAPNIQNDNDELAIASLILSFNFSILGLILRIMSIVRANKRNARKSVYAIVGVIISVICIILQIITVVLAVNGIIKLFDFIDVHMVEIKNSMYFCIEFFC